MTRSLRRFLSAGPVGATSLICLPLALALGPSSALRGDGVFDWAGTTGCASSWTADGLVVTNARGTICTSDGTGINSVSSGTRFSNDVQGLRVVHANGIPFTPLDIRIAEYSRSVKPPFIEFVGYKPDGGTVTVQAPLDGVADGPGGAEDFQTFVFPATFAGIVRLEVPADFWSFDDLAFSTVVPPPLPAFQTPAPSFRFPFTRSSQSIHLNRYLVAPGYLVSLGFGAADSTLLALSADSVALGDTYSPHYSPEAGALYFVDYLRTAIRRYKDGVTTTAATPSDTSNTPWPMARVDLPRWVGGPLFFLGYRTESPEQFGLFLKGAGPTTQALVNPQTSLPGPSGTVFSTPHAFPTDIAVHPIGYAFDTSLVDSPATRRLYATFFGGPFRHIVAENQSIPVATGFATVLDFSRFAFNANGDLEVDATLDTGKARLRFDNSGLREVVPLSLAVSPVNAGKIVSGTLAPAEFDRPALLSTADGEVYREKDGLFFRLLGVGDRIGEQTISMLELKTTLLYPPRAVVEVRYSNDPATSHIIELEFAEPVSLPPRFGAPYIHPESRDWFIPLDHLTAGRTYWLARSTDLQTWQRLWPVERVLPVQHVFIPREQTESPRVFFRVEEER